MTMREGKDGGGKGPLLSEDESLTLATGNGQVLFEPTGVAFAWQAGGGHTSSGAFCEDGTTPALPRSQTLATTTAYGVRRLTPVECERLQGFPDGWTEPAGSDSARYRALGNAVTVNVPAWLFARMREVAA
jgi:site-specific DNA-cytosine methylase